MKAQNMIHLEVQFEREKLHFLCLALDKLIAQIKTPNQIQDDADGLCGHDDTENGHCNDCGSVIETTEYEGNEER